VSRFRSAPTAVPIWIVAVVFLYASCSRTSKTPLEPLVIRSATVQFPIGARLDNSVAKSPASVRVTWANASAVKTRCGERADAELVFGPSLLPPSYWNCGRYNPFAGGSADGECPISNVCVAAILGVQMICESDDDACRGVAESFATTSP
jgi:hypothetical protein